MAGFRGKNDLSDATTDATRCMIYIDKSHIRTQQRTQYQITDATTDATEDATRYLILNNIVMFRTQQRTQQRTK